MSEGNIYINPTQAVTTVSTLTDGQDAVTQAGSRLATLGTNVGATSSFHFDLTQYVSNLKTQAEQVRSELADLQDAVVKTISDLGQQDEQLAQQTSTFMAGVEAVAVASVVKSFPSATSVFPSAATGIG